ncbi:MAG: SIMPL domain-containing protein [Paracoccaceae bacterium]
MRLMSPMIAALVLVASGALAEERLTVIGEGQAFARPDLATVRIGVETVAGTAAAAMTDNSSQAAALIAAAKARGVAPADIQTSGLSIYPMFEDRQRVDNSAPKLIGFTVSNEVTLRVRDLPSVGETLGVLVAAGANRMNGVEFGFADDTALRDEARRNAVADALRKAQLYASAAGVKLGSIFAIEEMGGGGGPSPRAMQFKMADSSVPVEAGETGVTAMVSIVWEIDEAN